MNFEFGTPFFLLHYSTPASRQAGFLFDACLPAGRFDIFSFRIRVGNP
jgi:hypothetical protein